MCESGCEEMVLLYVNTNYNYYADILLNGIVLDLKLATDFFLTQIVSFLAVI